MAKKKLAPKESTDEDRRKSVRPLIDYWARVLGLSRSHLIMFGFVDELPLTADGAESAAHFEFDGPYRDVSISIKRSFVDHVDAYRLEFKILHELIHTVLMPISSEVQRLFGDGEAMKRLAWAEETVADHLTQVLISLPREEE